MKRLFELIRMFYWNVFASPEKQARHLGVKIGKNCLIGTRYWPSEPYLITIGNYVQLTHCVSIYTHGGGQAIRQQHPDFDVFGKVVIEDWAYIGAFCQIMPGVTIGEGALVAAGSVVTKSVAPHTVVAGNPAKYICTTEEFYERNKQYDLKTKELNYLTKKKLLLSMSDDKFIKK